MSAVSYIDTQQALDAFCASCDDDEQLMLDTEFMRERTYFPKLCLIQIAAGDRIVLVDPLAIEDKTSLWTLFSRAGLVLHAARQDIEVIHLESGALPARILDTQVAAGLCGYAPQIGYAGLVSEICEVAIDKTHQRTDWSRRPLNQSVLDYAADDVRYLIEVNRVLALRLRESGRQAWAEADSAAQLDPSLYAIDTGTAWRRLKGLSQLRGLAHSRAIELARWRETVALNKDLPRQWVLKDTELLALANSDPNDSESVKNAFLSPKTAGRYQRELAELLRQTEPAETAFQPRPRPDAAERALTKELGNIVTAKAGELGVEAEVLAPVRELRAAAAGERELRALQGWRREVIGEALLSALPD